MAPTVPCTGGWFPLSDPGVPVPLVEAARAGDAAAVRDLVGARGADANVASARDGTALHAASRGGHATVIRVLLRVPGVEADRPFRGVSPLHLASLEGHEEAVEALLEAPLRVDVNVRAHDGMAPLHWAALRGDAAVAEALIATPGIDANAVNRHGRTPLHMASRGGCTHAQVVKVLLAAPGIDVNRTNPAGWTPLHYACRARCAKTAAILVAAGADPDRRDARGWTPLDAACSTHGDSDACILAIKRTLADAELVATCKVLLHAA